jgi:branched-chain amino acid transport system substrate-binding protein
MIFDTLSSPVANALLPRVMGDGVILLQSLVGRGEAIDGKTFKWVFPIGPTVWAQAANNSQYIKDQAKGDLKGKKIAFVYIDTPFGKEPLPLLQELAKQRGFELLTFPYAPPGNEQAAVWTQVRRASPNWSIIWGAGVGQTVSVKEAIRNGISPDKVASVIWLSETDMKVVGTDAAKGVLKFEGAAAGREPKVIQDILREVIAKGKGAGKDDIVGSAYYNIGVMWGAVMVEGARRGLELNKGATFNAEVLNQGLRSITNFSVEGLSPALTITKTDHQGGGMGRVSQWDGTNSTPKSDGMSASQDVEWKLIRESSAEFQTTGK